MPAGLVNYKPLATTMQANVDNYTQVNSLPSFRLFAWFFVIPGLLLVLFSGWGLVVGEGKWFTLPTTTGPRPSRCVAPLGARRTGPEPALYVAAERTIPAATVLLVASSIRMKLPVARFSAYGSTSNGPLSRSTTVPMSFSASS